MTKEIKNYPVIGTCEGHDTPICGECGYCVKDVEHLRHAGTPNRAAEYSGEWIYNSYAYTRSDSAHGNFHIREEGNGDCIAHTETERAAQQIVSDHNGIKFLGDRLEAQAERLAKMAAQRNRYWEQVEVLGDVLRKVREACNHRQFDKVGVTVVRLVTEIDDALTSIAEGDEEGDSE